MKKISEKILKEINQEQIKPIPKIRFWIKNFAMWFFSFISMVIGIVSIALVLYNLTSKDWDIYNQLGDTAIGYIASSLPYIWLALIIISLVISVLNIEHSKNGYKYSPLKITILSLVLALLIGFVTFELGGGKLIDESLGKYFISYQTVEANKEAVWNQSSNGLFSGTIVETNAELLTVESSFGENLKVFYGEAIIRGNVDLKNGNKIKIIGVLDGENINASEIRPWGSGTGRGFRGGHK